MIEPILQQVCYHEGRGPELQAVRYATQGKSIRAVEYFNPDNIELKHLHFVKPQVYMFTPEEVYNSESGVDYWAKFRPAAIISLGKSAWLESFAQQHLARCSQFQIMFYDQYLDIICEEIIFGHGAFQSAA